MTPQQEYYDVLASSDEVVDYEISGDQKYYILSELDLGPTGRVRLNGITKLLPMDAIRRHQLPDLSPDPIYLEVEGDNFPDLIEDNGVFLVSSCFWEYVQEKIAVEVVQSQQVFITGKGGLVEDYYLLIPPVIDCVLPETARYNKLGFLEYFELDTARIGQLEIFQVPKFPHLIVTAKLNRVDYAGFSCICIENYFNYEIERDRLFKERSSGQRLAKCLADYERALAAVGEQRYKYNIVSMLNREQLRREIRQGWQEIWNSQTGGGFEVEKLVDRFIVFFWSWDNFQVILAEPYRKFFSKVQFTITAFEPIYKLVGKLPPKLAELTRITVEEALLYQSIQEGKGFIQCQALHQGGRFRLYLQEENSLSQNPPLFYDYKSSEQQKLESTAQVSSLELTAGDLREYDFRGKSMSGLKIESKDFRRAKFTGANLTGVTFINCDLTGTDFQGSCLERAKFDNCHLDRSIFDEANLAGVTFTNCYLNHVSFIKANLSKALFQRQDLNWCYFHQTKLSGAVFEVQQRYEGNVFRFCDLTAAKFYGGLGDDEMILANSDFRNADLTGCQVAVDVIAYTNFRVAKLNAADFSGCHQLIGCDLRGSSWLGGDLSGVALEECDFSGVKLAQLKQKKGISLMDNNLSGADLTGFDFSTSRYCHSNDLTLTNLSNARMPGANFCASQLIQTIFTGAQLTGACFRTDQLTEVELSFLQKKELVVRDEIIEDQVSPE